MTGKQLRKYKRKNELHAPLTAQCACSLLIFNQKKGDVAISKLINGVDISCPEIKVIKEKKKK